MRGVIGGDTTRHSRSPRRRASRVSGAARCAGNAPDDGARLAGRAHDNRYKKLDIPEISQ